MNRYCTVLTIAGSDSGGGAGIQADLKTFAALKCYGVTALTAVTAQNTRGVRSVLPLPASFVAMQLDAVLSDIGVDAIKIGMLFDSDTIAIVKKKLNEGGPVPVVLDPVITSKNGASLLKPRAIHLLKTLFSLVTVITPNLDEASALLGYRVETRQQMEKAALRLLEMGAGSVLLKGGHLKEEAGSDCFCSNEGKIQWFCRPGILTKNTHGTGCTLSSAIAAYLALGLPLDVAICEGKRFLHEALAAGSIYSFGSGHGPLHHFYNCWSKS